MGYRVVDVNDLSYEERPPKPGEGTRLAADVTTAAGLAQSRAKLWRYPPRSTGRRHRDHVQEEVFVVVSGSPAVMLGDPPVRHDAPAGTLVVVEPGTPLKWFNDGKGDALIFAYGAPAESRAEILES